MTAVNRQYLFFGGNATTHILSENGGYSTDEAGYIRWIGNESADKVVGDDTYSYLPAEGEMVTRIETWCHVVWYNSISVSLHIIYRDDSYRDFEVVNDTADVNMLIGKTYNFDLTSCLTEDEIMDIQKLTITYSHTPVNGRHAAYLSSRIYGHDVPLWLKE